MTVAELGRRMSSVEFGDWQRYADLEPFGPLAEGATAAWFANVNRDRKRRPGAILAAEALTAFAADPAGPVPQDEASMMTRDLSWAATMKKVAKPRVRTRRKAPA